MNIILGPISQNNLTNPMAFLPGATENNVRVWVYGGVCVDIVCLWQLVLSIIFVEPNSCEGGTSGFYKVCIKRSGPSRGRGNKGGLLIIWSLSSFYESGERIASQPAFPCLPPLVMSTCFPFPSSSSILLLTVSGQICSVRDSLRDVPWSFGCRMVEIRVWLEDGGKVHLNH